MAAIAAAAKADPWEEGGALSGALNPRYAKIRDVLQEKHQQSRVARRRGGRRRDDLKDSAYKMPQIVIEQEPASLRRVGWAERRKNVCVYMQIPKPILYERGFKLPPFRSRPLWGTPRVGKGGGGGVLALVEHVDRLDRAEPWSWLRERGLLAGGWPWWPGRPWRAPGASEAGGRHSRGTGLRPDPRESLYGPHRV